MEHVAAPKLPESRGGSWSPGARGGLGATLGLVAEAEAMRHVAAPELP
jgi:hypothetical protein